MTDDTRRFSHRSDADLQAELNRLERSLPDPRQVEIFTWAVSQTLEIRAELKRRQKERESCD